ncbi:hypothetical protein [Corynebacterium bouchesdurhonense]|uniref:hypothetical protein n=1 Tax=Corynebacterium bouchesdurhonense TaxID=1720192 RepID=UPI00082D628D|nr:hypothetical protein [Corynebacterium bouchesdurhonense]
MAHSPRTIAAAAAVALTLPLAACGQNDPDGTPATSAETTTATSTAEESTTTTSSSPTSTTTRTTASTTTGATSTSAAGAAAATGASTSNSSNKEEQALREVAEQFSTLAPAEFFDKLDACTSTGIAGSYDCSGEGIGQFQFFASDSKAASTAQLLTELRSSRVVEDSGARIVGWSTLGTSAIITVVDVDKGQVLQQLTSSDQGDPRERIYELGLAEQVDTVSTPGGAGSKQSTTRTAPAGEPTG